MRPHHRQSGIEIERLQGLDLGKRAFGHHRVKTGINARAQNRAIGRQKNRHGPRTRQ